MKSNLSRIRFCLFLAGLSLLSACVTPGRPSTEATPPYTPSPEHIPPGHVKAYEVFGERYYILASSRGYDESGTASWYGPQFDGRPTANGEIFDMHQISAAHKSLPLPTWVKVTNLDNQRSIIVRVNDRGPFIHGRLIDLSYAAAVELDMIGPGTAPVHVVALDIAAPEKTATLPPPATNGHAFIQVGAFADEANARKLVTQLEQSGFSNVSQQQIILGDRTLQRVKIGPLDPATDPSLLLNRLAQIGLTNARIVSQ